VSNEPDETQPVEPDEDVEFGDEPDTDDVDPDDDDPKRKGRSSGTSG
jgi:hypothetical protein